MLQPPDQFQTRVYVKLPFSDSYLLNEEKPVKIRKELKEHFRKPLLTVVITPKNGSIIKKNDSKKK